jgi:hypothetical protein
MMMRSNSKPRVVELRVPNLTAECIFTAHRRPEIKFPAGGRAIFVPQKMLLRLPRRHRSIFVSDYPCSSNLCSRFKTHSPKIVHAA